MKIPKTPIAFDYDLWTTEDGKCMVRVKRTGEVSEVDRKVMRILRAEESGSDARMALTTPLRMRTAQRKFLIPCCPLTLCRRTM